MKKETDNKLLLPAWFGSGMILQQKAPTRVYGIAEPNAEVSVTLERYPLDGHEITPRETQYGIIFADNDFAERDGFFEIKLPLCEASFDPHILTISSGRETVT